MNELEIAVAGARKTQGIVDACVGASPERRILVLAFTQTSQAELETRIRQVAPFNPHIEVLGWYAFLLRHFVRPYLPLLYPGHKLEGFNFDGDPGMYAKDARRHLDNEGRAYRCNLASLAHKVHVASKGSVVDRLQHIYTDVFIDEAQDIAGWSLEIVDVLFSSKLNVHLVGDMRQAMLSTDPRDKINTAYKHEKVINWYKRHEKKGVLLIKERTVTYRSNQAIAALSDQIFDPSLLYSPTTSASEEISDHSGIFSVAPCNVQAYVQKFAPLALHWRSGLGGDLGISFTTFGIAKGRTVQHVMILPTEKVRRFLEVGGHLEGKTACALYIGITRAVHSVAFILDDSASVSIGTVWAPPEEAGTPDLG